MGVVFLRCSCSWCWTDYILPSTHSIKNCKKSKDKFKHRLTLIGIFYARIWPFNESPCVFPNDVVLCEYEEWPVDGEAVLPVGDGVVQSHGPGSLRFGLFHGSRQSRRRRVLSVPAALQVPVSGVHRAGSALVSEPSHSTKRWGDRRLTVCYYRTTSSKG